jgi:hypothetical protein
MLRRYGTLPLRDIHIYTTNQPHDHMLLMIIVLCHHAPIYLPKTRPIFLKQALRRCRPWPFLQGTHRAAGSRHGRRPIQFFSGIVIIPATTSCCSTTRTLLADDDHGHRGGWFPFRSRRFGG